MGNVNYSEAPAKVYQNLGLGGFVDSGFSLPSYSSGNLAWGDYNNDGRVDLLVTCLTGTAQKITKLYRNTGSGMVDSGVTLPQKGGVSVAWVDANCDAVGTVEMSWRVALDEGSLATIGARPMGFLIKNLNPA